MTRKLTVAAVSLVLTAAVAWFALARLQREAPMVASVDNTGAIERLLESRRAAPAAQAPRDYPPPLVREPLDEETAALYFPANDKSTHWTYDPLCYSRRVAHQAPYFRKLEEHPEGGWELRTNDYGMREDEDVRTEQPDLRIVVTGDSHVDGVCAQAESFVNLLEVGLALERAGEVVESLNAGVGGFNLYNYVGMFERLAHLAPDLYVVVVYGGNDFSGAANLQCYFERRPPPASRARVLTRRVESPEVLSLGSQELFQEAYFADNPSAVEASVDLACSISVELERQCAETGSALLFVYLPPPARAQPAHYRKTARTFLHQAGLKTLELGVSDRIADRWLTFLGARDIPAVDLRPYFRRANEPLYWRTDHHLNLAGHQLVAEILYEPVTELLARRESESR
jgi:hypothetical protein